MANKKIVVCTPTKSFETEMDESVVEAYVQAAMAQGYFKSDDGKLFFPFDETSHIEIEELNS